MMYCIMYYYGTTGEMISLIGTQTGMFALVNLLERSRIDFKVSDIATGPLSQKDLGYGGFQYWLPREDSFGEPI